MTLLGESPFQVHIEAYTSRVADMSPDARVRMCFRCVYKPYCRQEALLSAGSHIVGRNNIIEVCAWPGNDIVHVE